MNALRPLMLVIALLGACWLYYRVTERRIATVEAALSATKQESRDLSEQLTAARKNERIVTQYIDRVQVVRERGATIVQKVPVYVTPSADAACVVPDGFVRLHDAAATSTLPGPAGAADAQPSGIALSTIGSTVADNYAVCHATTEQLIALQAWVRANTRDAP